MITCSKCNNSFAIDWRAISKGSIANCPHCNNECLVKLFDLQNVSQENVDDYNQDSHEESGKVDAFKHIITLIIILKILVILFIIGIYNISLLQNHFPFIAELYEKIHIIPHKGVDVREIKIDLVNDNKSMVVDLEFYNQLDVPELVSDLEILVLDPYNNTIASTLVKPNIIIKGLASKAMKINVVGINSNARKVIVILNGKFVKTLKIHSENNINAEQIQ